MAQRRMLAMTLFAACRRDVARVPGKTRGACGGLVVLLLLYTEGSIQVSQVRTR